MSIDVRAETIINRPKAEVAELTLDFRSDPLWRHSLVKSSPVDAKLPSEGSKVARVARFLGHELEYLTEVLEYDPESYCVLQTSGGAYDSTLRFELEAIAEDQTRASIHMEGEARHAFKLTERFLARRAADDLHRNLAALKALLEIDLDVSTRAGTRASATQSSLAPTSL